MSFTDLEPTKARAGQLLCTCDADSETTAQRPALAASAAGFALTIIVQSLYVAVLPLAGAEIAERPALATLPYALTLVGALAASLPAAILTDAFGRRSGFALGASLGVAGACLAAWSIHERQFAALALGSFWLGTAQGFGFFYRHSAALAAKDKARAIAVVLGAGALAAIVAPPLLYDVQTAAGPFAPELALLIAGAVQILLLALSLALPGRSLSAVRAPRFAKINMDFLGVTVAAALAWLGMALIMAGSPRLMAGCGIGLSGRSELISWHILAMYAPAAILGLLLPNPRAGAIAPSNPRAGAICVFGLALLAAAVVLIARGASFLDFGIVMIMAGCGWSLAMFGAMLAIHEKGVVARPLLALHDAALFSGAIAGALLAALLH